MGLLLETNINEIFITLIFNSSLYQQWAAIIYGRLHVTGAKAKTCPDNLGK